MIQILIFLNFIIFQYCHTAVAEVIIPMKMSEQNQTETLTEEQKSNSNPDYFYMPVGKQPNSGISYFQYFEILQYFSTIYPQIQFPIEWMEPYFAAFAKKENKIRQVHVWGGLVRMPTATLPIVLTAICHEIGHHMGGNPLQDQVKGGEWASAEGQADYFAARHCLPRTFYDHPHWFDSLEKDFKQINSTQIDLKKCLDNKYCRVSVLSGYQMFQSFSKLPHSMPEKIEFQLIAEPTTKSILQTYPPLQCRFETFFSGGYCLIDAKSKNCQRPVCWYRENSK